MQAQKALHFMTPDGRASTFRSDPLPAPFHLGRSFVRAHHLSLGEKLRYLREVRIEMSVRLASITITAPTTISAHQVASTLGSVLPTRCEIARQAMKIAAPDRTDPAPVWMQTAPGDHASRRPATAAARASPAS